MYSDLFNAYEKGELDGEFEDTVDVLSPEQIQDLHRLLFEARRGSFEYSKKIRSDALWQASAIHTAGLSSSTLPSRAGISPPSACRDGSVRSRGRALPLPHRFAGLGLIRGPAPLMAGRRACRTT